MTKKLIRYNQPNISSSDIIAVNKVLRSEQLTQGEVSKTFQNALIKYTNSKYCLLFNSASTALIAACKALDLTLEDILWTSAVSFVASSNCALFFNSKIEFLDIDLKSFNIDINLLEKKLKIAKVKKTSKSDCCCSFRWNISNLKDINKLSKNMVSR